MALAQAHPFSLELHKEHPELAALGLQEHDITGKVSYDPATKELGFEIHVAGLGRTFTGTCANVSATAPPSTTITGTILGTPAGAAETFTVTATSIVTATSALHLIFMNGNGVPDKWLAASPVPGLTGGPYSGTGKWV